MNLKNSRLMSLATSILVVGSSIVGFGVTASQAASTPLTVTFESNDTTGASLGGAADFGGNASSVVTSTVGANTSQVGKIVNGGECWSGTTFLIRPAGDQLISDVSKIVTVDVYSTTATDDIKFKLEGGPADPAREVDVAHNGNGWQTLTFDFATGPAFAPGNYIKASIFAGFSCGGAAKPAEVLFDNVSFPGATSPDVVLPRTAPSVLVNFESGDTSGYNLISFGGAGSSVATDAPTGGSVGSTKAMKVVDTGECWAGTTVLIRGSKESLLSDGKTTVTANIYAPSAGKDIKLKMENAASAGAPIEADVTSVAGWNKYSFVFAAYNSAVDYNMASIFTNFTCGGGSKAGESYYIDDIAFNGASGAALGGGVVTPPTPSDNTVVARMNGLNADNSLEHPELAGEWVGNGWYAAGLRYIERGLTVGSSNTFSFQVNYTNGTADTADDVPYANKSVTLVLGKAWSASNASVTVNGQTASGNECWCGNNQAQVSLTTNASGVVTFTLTNNNSPAQAGAYQAPNSAHPTSGTRLFSQITLVGEKGNQDVIDVVDLNFYKQQDAPAPTVYNARLADWNATNSFDGTHIWGDGGIGSWFDIYTGYFAHYVGAGSTFTLRYRVTNAETGANAPDGTPVTMHLGRGWSGSNAKFQVGNYVINGTYPNGGANDQKALSLTTVGGYVSVTLTSLDTAADATTNPGNPKANPADNNPVYMQVGLTVDGNSITRQDWVNIVVTAPASAPSITSVSATSGKRGQAIDIVGTNLGDALGSTVTLYTAATTKTAAISTPVTILSVNADGTRLTVASPNITQKGYFKVTNTGGTATASALFSSSTTVTAKPVITLSASLVKEIGSTFTLNGTNIASSSAIAIGGVSASFSIVNANSVVVTVPAGVVSGSTISATNPGGTTTTTKFVFQAAVIDSITQAARVGQTVTVTGSNLKATTVVFAGNKSAKPVINTATQLTFVVPAGALSGAIRITTGAGSVNTDSFTVTPPAPTIASFTPTTGKKGVATVTVRGTNLLGATVTIGSTAVTVGSGATATSFKFVIPAGASTGRITVTTAGGTVTSTATLTVTN